MPITRSAKKLIALALTGAAVAGVAGLGSQAAGARMTTVATSNQGNPDAVPPILPPVPASERATIRSAEALSAQAFFYKLPATARYSGTEMSVYASVDK